MVPSVIKDSIRRIRKINNLPPCVLLSTFGVISLYASIPLDLCLSAFNDFLLDRNLHLKVANGILSTTELVLKKNLTLSISSNFWHSNRY